MARLGLGFEDLRAVNEKIVMVSISGYGQTGPYSQRPGYDVVGQAMGGIMSITGEADGRPMKCGPSIGDISSGMNMVIGVLAAMYRVKETGKGEWVDISLVDSVLGLCSSDYLGYHKDGVMPPRRGNNYGFWVPYGGCYQAADGYFNVGVGAEKYWKLLCENVLGRPELATDPRFCDHPARVEHREETDKLIADWCAELPVAEAVERLNKGGVPAAKVYDFADIDADEHFTVHRKMVRTMEHPILGELHYVSVPPIFKEAGLSDPTPADLMGQSNEAVYGECLGLTPEDLAELKKQGVI
jgi:formyl-CoA transferase